MGNAMTERHRSEDDDEPVYGFGAGADKLYPLIERFRLAVRCDPMLIKPGRPLNALFLLYNNRDPADYEHQFGLALANYKYKMSRGTIR